MNQNEVVQQILEIGRRMWQKEWVAANDGNISVKISDNEFLTTATGVSKGFMTEEMIILVDSDGAVIDTHPKYKPSSELKMHMEVYKSRKEINAVVHAHPPYSTSFAVIGKPLDQFILPEAVLNLGIVPVAKYATPSTIEVPESIQPFLEKSDTILLQHHGALTLGSDLETAYYRMETLEHYSKILHLTQSIGNINFIEDEQLERLIKLRKKLNISGRVSFDK